MSFEIDRIETLVVRLPPRADFRWLSLSRPLGEFVLVRIVAAGVEGWGEVVGLRDWGDVDGRRHGETPGTICSIVHDQLAPGLLGIDLRLGECRRRLDQSVVGNPYAKALLDIALDPAPTGADTPVTLKTIERFATELLPALQADDPKPRESG